MTTTYKLSIEAFKPLKRKLIIQALLFSLIPLFFFIFVLSTIGSLLFSFPILIFFLFGVIKELVKIRKTEKEWTSFSILLGEETIKKVQVKSPIIEVNYDEIVRLVEIPSSGISIQTHDPSKAIYIPFHLEGYDEIKGQLMKYKPIETSAVGVHDTLTTTLISIQPKRTIVKSLFLSSLAIVAPFLIFLLILFLIVMFVGETA
jgi:hypothetical protein